jgi:hypothetical protein
MNIDPHIADEAARLAHEFWAEIEQAFDNEIARLRAGLPSGVTSPNAWRPRDDELGGAGFAGRAELPPPAYTFTYFARGGLRAVERQPVVYTSSESHHSLVKAVRACGLGTDGLRLIPADARLALDPAALSDAIARDLEAGLEAKC